MNPFVFVLTRGPEDPSRAVRCFQFAKVAAEKGHPTSIFLIDNAVYFVNATLCERTKAPTGDELGDHMQALAALKVPVYVCKPCADARQIDEDDFGPNFSYGMAPQLIDLADQGKLFTF